MLKRFTNNILYNDLNCHIIINEITSRWDRNTPFFEVCVTQNDSTVPVKTFLNQSDARAFAEKLANLLNQE